MLLLIKSSLKEFYMQSNRAAHPHAHTDIHKHARAERERDRERQRLFKEKNEKTFVAIISRCCLFSFQYTRDV